MRAYFDEHIRAVNANDFSRLQGMFFTTCEICIDQYQTFKKYADRGQRIEGGSFHVFQLQGEPALHRRVSVTSVVQLRPARLVNKETGATVKKYPSSSKFGWDLVVSPQGTGWRVLSWGSVHID